MRGDGGDGGMRRLLASAALLTAAFTPSHDVPTAPVATPVTPTSLDLGPLDTVTYPDPPTTTTTVLVTTTEAPTTTAAPRRTVTVTTLDPSDMPSPQSKTTASSGRCGGSLPPCYVMERESGGDPTAVNYGGCGGRNCYGKWQMDPVTSRSLGYSRPMNEYDESVQDEAARRLYAMVGCSAWAC